MKVKKEDLKKGKFKLNITVEAPELLKYNRAAYQDLTKNVKIAGFRPGKAPRKLAEETVGEGRLASEALDKTIQQEYYLALQQENLIPVTPPKITISQYPNWGLELDEIGSVLIFEAEFEVMPEVKLSDYSKVKVVKKEQKKAEEDDVEKILLHLRKQKATFKEVDRGAKIGDRAEISYEGFLDNVKKDSMSAKNHPVVLGEKTLIPGFEEEIVGMKKEEEKKFDISFPKDYHAKDFAGRKAQFQVKLIDLKEIELPELNDQFAENFGHKKVVDLKIAITKSLKDEIETKEKQEMESEVIDKVLPHLKVEIPEGLIEQEVDRIIADMSKQVESRGLQLEKYLESIKKTLPEIRKDLIPQAEKNIRIGFLLGKVIEEQKYDPNDPQSGKKALDYIIKTVVK